MIYESECCYPDLIDFESTLKRYLGAKKDLSAGDLYQDFRAAYEWLAMAIHLCHYHGKHRSEMLSSVKSVAEGFIGRGLSEDAFLAAVCIVARLRPRGVKKGFNEITVKMPPFSDREKIAAAWKWHVEAIENKNHQ